MRPASQRFFIHSCIYIRTLIISDLATFLGTNSLSVLMCRKAVNQSMTVDRGIAKIVFVVLRYSACSPASARNVNRLSIMRDRNSFKRLIKMRAICSDLFHVIQTSAVLSFSHLARVRTKFLRLLGKILTCFCGRL